MITFKIILGIFLFISYVVMMSVMIILERDKPKNIIIWSVVFLFTQIVGYVIYIIIRHVFYKKCNSIEIKLREDEIYNNLISNKLNDNCTTCNHEVFKFNSLAFNTQTTANNNYELIHDYALLKKNLIDDIKKAKSYIIFEITRVNAKDFEEIKSELIKKAENNVVVKIVHDRQIGFKLKKELRKAGIKVYRFSKYN